MFLKEKSINYLTWGAVIAALYVALGFVTTPTFGNVQLRFVEALTILPVFTPAAIPGVTLGCLLYNILVGSAVLDIIFGSLATFIGAVGTYFLGKLIKDNRLKFIASFPPVISNGLIVPWVIITCYGAEGGYVALAIAVALGEILSVTVLGSMLMYALMPLRGRIFYVEDAKAKDLVQ